jgi:hypothetical protein
MEKTFEMKVDTLDADTVTLLPVVGTGVENPDFTSIVFEYGTNRDATLFPLDDAVYTITVRRK